MASNILSLAVIFAMAIVAIAIVLNIGTPAISTATKSSDLVSAESSVQLLDSAIRQVVSEGRGSVRSYPFTSTGKISTLPGENAIEMETRVDSSIFGYLTRTVEAGVVYIAGDDISCSARDGNLDGTTDLVVENSYLQAVFNYTPETAPLGDVDTSTILEQLREKTRGTTVSIENSSIMIDGNASSEKGTGYTELLTTGNSRPFCTVHAYVNATGVSYDVYYRLYAGADFLEAFVRNIEYS